MIYEIQTFNMVIPNKPIDSKRVVIYALSLEKNEMIGHLDLDILDECSAITWVFVAKEWRGQNVATKLLNKAWEVTKENDLNKMGLVVDDSFQQYNLINFYESQNFVVGGLEGNGVAMYRKDE